MSARPRLLRLALGALLAHWRRHPGLAAALLLGLALATALWTGVQAVNAEARASYARAARALDRDWPMLVPRTGDSLPLADYVALARAGWRVAPVIEGEVMLGGVRLHLLGVDPLSAPDLPQSAGSGSGDPGAALRRWIGPPGEILVPADTAAQLRAAGLPQALRISADLPPGTAVTDIGLAARLLGMPDRLTRLLLLAPPPGPLDAIAPDLQERAPDRAADISGLTASFHLTLGAFGALSFLVGLFIVQGAVGLAFEQRRTTLRTLRALGLPLPVLMAAMAIEALIMAAVAGLAGVALGYLLAAALLPDVAATLRGLYGAPVPGGLVLRPGWVAAGLGMAALGTGLATARSFRQLATLPLLAPAQPRAWATASDRQARRLALLGLALLLAAATLAGLGSDLPAAFAALAALLLGMAALLPFLLGSLLDGCARHARRVLAQWFWADARQQLPGLSLALMALMLALATNIGVSTMVSSFRSAFTEWLDQRLSASVYLNFDSPAAASAALPWARAHADAVLPRATHEAALDGAPGDLLGLADDPATARSWPLLASLPDAWPRLAAGNGVLINEQLAIRQHLRPGDQVKIDAQLIVVLGVYPDYGNPRPQAALSLPVLLRLYPDTQVTRLMLMTPPERAASVTTAAIAALGLRPDQAVDQQAVQSRSMAVFDRTFAVTSALNLLTLAVAAVAIFTSLSTLQAMRLAQLAPLWALGVTRRRLGALDLARVLLLAALTAALALPAGLALGWVLLARVNVAAFGWRLPMQVFPRDWLWLALAALLAALLAGLLPALRLARSRPQRLLQLFSLTR